MPLFLALASSVVFGAADFTGGLATKRSPAVSVVVATYVTGLSVALLAVPFFGEGVPQVEHLLWGAGAGIAGGLGLVVLFHALATTRMNVAAPAAALFGAIAPIGFGILTGERPTALAWLGIAVALPAVALLGAGNEDDAARSTARRALLLAAVVGIGFGTFGIMISRTPAEAGMWPLVAARVGSVIVIGAIAAGTGRPLWPRKAWRLALLSGAIDMVSNILFLLAVRETLLSLVVVITSLYPASTIVLARVVVGERLTRHQVAGLALGTVGVVLISVA